MGFKYTNGRNLHHTGVGEVPTVGSPTLGGEACKSWDHRDPAAGAGTLEGGAERLPLRKEGEMLRLPPLQCQKPELGSPEMQPLQYRAGDQKLGESRPLTVPLTQ